MKWPSWGVVLDSITFALILPSHSGRLRRVPGRSLAHMRFSRVAARSYGFLKPAAGKTGTTDDFRDAWFVGYVPQLLCAVWIGYDDNSSLNMSGAEAALPIWVNFMKEATKNMPEKNFQIPSTLTLRQIDPYTGGLGSPYCPVVIPEIF